MKKIYTLIILSCLAISNFAQTITNNKKYSQISIRGGLDNATKHNFTDYVKMPLKGFNVGASFDKYWNWYGLGIDVDYMKNEKPIYNDADFKVIMGVWDDPYWYSHSTSSTDLTRLFVGIGPSFKHQSANNKFTAEINLRGGITKTNGSSLYYQTKASMAIHDPWWTRSGDATTSAPTDWGTFYHNGYKNEILATAKAQVRFNYFVTPKLGINVGGYYMHYFGSDAKYNYLEVNNLAALNYFLLTPQYKVSSLTSIGATAGLSYRFGQTKSSKSKAEKNTLMVTVKDELTGLALSDAEVTIVNQSGKVYTGTTNAMGSISFDKVAEGTYKATGTLHGIATTENNVTVNSSNKNASTTLIHNDPRFTVQGKSINISTNQPESGVSVSLKNNDKGSIKMGTSQSGNGAFGFQIDANSDYELVGKKANYISNIEKISTKGLTRSQTLYVELELGVQNVEKGKAIVLQNIYHDLDKANIREEASSDLEKLTIFLIDNPTFKIEIASHTDSRGSDEYNLKLSQDRAQAVVAYLTQKGIASTRLIAKGYGETKLINKCANDVTCTEAEHQKNRRTAFTVISE